MTVAEFLPRPVEDRSGRWIPSRWSCRQPEQIELNRLALTAPTADDVVVDVDWSGVSTGTERLLWSGRMPPFPGMGYPLVPGYELVGRVVEAGSATELASRPAASSFPARNASARCAACSAHRPRAWWCRQSAWCRSIRISASAESCWRWRRRPITPSRRAAPSAPDCIVGHGVLGRLLARISIAVRNDPPDGVGEEPGARRRRHRLRRHRSRARYAPRLQEHLRRQRRCQPARFADRPHRARRRDRAGRLLQRAAVLCVSARVHARGAHSRRRRMATVRSRRDQGTDRVRDDSRSTA